MMDNQRKDSFENKMLPFSSLLSSHIQFLLQSLNDSSLDSVLYELRQTLDYGIEGSILLLQTCLGHMNLLEEDMQRKQFILDIFSAVFIYLLVQPNSSTVCCETFRNIIISKKFLWEFCIELQLSISEKVALGLALADSEHVEVRAIGQDFSIGLIEDLCGNPVSVDSVEKIQNIILFLYQSEGLTKYVDSFMQMVALMEPKERTPLILAPLLKGDGKEASFPRNMDMFHNCYENDFDSLLVEMEKETSVADIMREVGYRCTIGSTHCKKVLSNFLPLNEVTLSRILSTIAHTYSGLEDSQLSHSIFCSATGSSATLDISCPDSWNGNILVDSINQLAPGINWKIAMEHLDHDGFYIPDSQAFSFFMSIYACACQDPFPLHAVCGSVWKNVDGQLSFLRYAVSAPVEIFTFEHSVRKQDCVEVSDRHELSSVLGNYAWLSLDLLDVLCQLAERGNANSVRAMIEYPLKHCPEVLLLGIAQINTAYNLLQHDVSSTIFPKLVENSMGRLIFHLWQSNSKFVARGFLDMIKANQSSISRMLAFCHKHKILTTFLEQIPFSYSIRLSVFAFQEAYLCLEKWLKDNLINYRDIFAKECLNFLKEISLDAAEDMSPDLFQHTSILENIYFKTSSAFLKVFRANIEHISSDCVIEDLERMNRASLHVKPRLQNFGTSDLSISYGYADYIEAEANSFYFQMFSGLMPINVMSQMLSQFNKSSKKRLIINLSTRRKQLLFEHVIKNLLDEYKFFPRYPEELLKIVSVLFGSLIKHRLVTNLNLGIALRSVLDALHKPIDSKLFVFGTKALEQFPDRLVELPHYCTHILQISHLRGTHSELVNYVESALAWNSSNCLEKDEENTYDPYPQDGSTAATLEKWELPGVINRQPSHQLCCLLQMQQRHGEVLGDRIKTSTASNFPLPSREVTTTRFGSALNIETLLAAVDRRNTPLETPASDAQDKIFFMINNISSSNVDAKVKEFTEILNERYYPWFAQYMVMKRASIEPNFHDLYLTFLEKVNSKLLNKEIVKAAYENCKVILKSELIKSSSEERSLLKNLGSWLGKLTIGRNQVLRAREIDPKSLIIEAYERGLMTAVVPFTSKILQPCQHSLAYTPPNPWTMAIVGLLAEIYALPNLKMNLKFDIEVLFKNLGIDMKKVSPTFLLRNRLCKIEGNLDFSFKDVRESQPSAVTEINIGVKSILNTVDLEAEIVNTSHFDDQLASQIAKMRSRIIINKELSTLVLHHLQRGVHFSMERAVKMLLSMVVQHCVPVAIQTTKELVLKDFATESDETCIYDAAHSMVASLAGSLAHVACKETLCTSISCQLRDLFLGLNVASEHIEQAVALVIDDNVDFGCEVIEQAATEKALQTIDCEIALKLTVRRKHREGIDPSYYYANINAQGPNELLSYSSFSTSFAATDDINLLAANQSSVGCLSLNATAPEVHSEEELTATAESLPRTPIDQQGSGIVEPSLSVSDIRERYQVISQKASVLFAEWHQTYVHHGANDAACAYFVSKLQRHGFLNGDDMSDCFFCFLMEYSVSHCLSSEKTGSSLMLELPQIAEGLLPVVDAFAKLVVVILKYHANEHLLSKIFQLTVRVIQRNAEEKKASFNPRPYFKLFVNWLLDLVSPHAALADANFQVLISFANTFHALQPLKVPAFSFAWLELISHKSFFPKLLTSNAPEGWVYVQLLLVDWLKFMEPYLRNAKLQAPIGLLYKGTLRVLLVLLHDFPDFLCNYHFSFCDVIPSTCIQLRSIILSAYPSNMQLPDLSTPYLKTDLMPEMRMAPRTFSEVDAALRAKHMKNHVDEYLKTRRQASPFLSKLKRKLLLPTNEAAQAWTRYDVPLINSLVLYVGMQTIQQLPKTNMPGISEGTTGNGPMELYEMGPVLTLFQTLVMELDTEGRYFVLSAIANQIRYPSSHTHLYSFVMLHLFDEAKQEIIQEQITRVFVERLMVNNPHPWGLWITFNELIKNPRYKFWRHDFIKCSPEIEKILKTNLI